MAAAEAERQQLLDAFTHERAKREADALSARRDLEAQLEDGVGACLINEDGIALPISPWLLMNGFLC